MELSLSLRARRIFSEERRKIFAQTDRLFAGLMVFQWLAGIAAALWISPRAWEGATSQIHLHVWLAIFLGGIIGAFPILLVWLQPGHALTRYVISVAQMLMSSLLIHLTGGRLETHFHVFGSLAFLAFYRDWRVLVPATIVTAADHYLRGVYYPQSAYGVLMVSQWRWLEHAAWVLFEDLFLVVVCRRTAQEMWEHAVHSASLHLSEQRYRSVVEQTADGICLTDAITGTILECNPAYERILGFGPGELIGTSIYAVMTDEKQVLGEILQCLIKDKRFAGEILHRRRDGSMIEMEANICVIESDDRKICCSVVRDISERKEAEEKLRTFATQLERSNRELQDFASVASHDLQEPLRKVQVFGDRLQARYRDVLGPQGLEYLGRMQNAAGRMQTLISDLLTFSRVTTKAQPFVPTDLTQVVREVVSDLEIRIEQTKGRVEIQSLPVIPADPLQMRQLFQNLIGNALKFHHPDVPPVVTVSAEITTGKNEAGRITKYCVLTVADNGIGFDEKYLDRIFAIFQRLHGRDQYEGTGVGLAVCRKIADRHHGTISATSQPGQGAKFIITLPLWQPTGEVAKAATAVSGLRG